MTYPALQVIEKKIIQFFRDPSVVATIRDLTARLPHGADVFVAGGSIRNIIIETLHGNPPETKDIDLFIGNIDPDFPLSRAFAKKRCIKTELGGIRWQPVSCRFAFDISLLPRFVLFEKY